MKALSSLFLLLLVSSTLIKAQSGPSLPCPECEQNFIKPIPYEGSWYNPEQSGSGFLIDIQNNILVGYYFGYKTDGEPIWALFTGTLEKITDQNALWKVTAPLQSFREGGCLSCDYQAPVTGESLGEIELVFNRLTHASFSVNGGNVQNIVPLYFGYSLLDYANQQPAFYIPELEGWWTVFIDRQEPASPIFIGEEWTYSNYIVHVGKSVIGSNGQLFFRSIYYAQPPEILPIGDIICNRENNQGIMLTKCQMHQPFYLPFNIDLANISSNRIYGENELGDRLEMVRLSSDYCASIRPEDCINTGIFD